MVHAHPEVRLYLYPDTRPRRYTVPDTIDRFPDHVGALHEGVRRRPDVASRVRHANVHGDPEARVQERGGHDSLEIASESEHCGPKRARWPTIAMAEPDDDRGLIRELVGDGRPALALTAVALFFYGALPILLATRREFLSHDVTFLGMTAV